jgi:glycosyltransferase involved in cell wall biosynthesis
VARRIRKYYRREADVIQPPADTDFFILPDEEPKRDYFLIVSALVPYKKIDLAIEVFNPTAARLKIVGSGPEYRRLRKQAGANIELLGQVSAEDLRCLYQNARALILPGEEDFGIAAVEAQACGTPVVALGRGGALESIVPGETGLLYSDPSAAGLRTALDNFRDLKFNKTSLRSNAMKFSRPLFRQKLIAHIDDKWAAFKAQP